MIYFVGGLIVVGLIIGSALIVALAAVGTWLAEWYINRPCKRTVGRMLSIHEVGELLRGNHEDHE